MKKSFYLAAAISFGSLITLIPVAASASRNTSNQTRYYYLSFSRMARDIRNTGFLRFLSIDGQEIAYTHTNNNGRKPAADAKLVWVGFGRSQAETFVVVDHDTYVGYLKRKGAKFAMPLPAAATALRPFGIPVSEKDSNPKNFG